ncbi:hypothetical protein [Pectobacterium brasiliense]|uniref:hypothetical protein n=1 Tax=Pectobacterium brasiliense TaxID=180957 RepID=UPI00057FBE27|nr:hypothetical protein [Pectobacterium brasiliense]KHS87073.1 dihydrolipoamide acetyltransferase [Pectobacterium brasiliense]
MSTMVFRHGDSKKWKGVGYDFEIVSDDELQEFLDAGWFAHPDELFKSSPEPEPEPEPVQRKKPGPKPKADKDADSD